MNTIIAAPILIHFATAVLCVLAWRALVIQRALSVAGALGSVAAAVAIFLAHKDGTISTVEMGGWSAPFGITIVMDPFSALMVLFSSITGAACVIYSLGAIDERRERHGYHALVHAMLAGVSGAFTTGDLFNMYVWFEVMLMSSFVLLTLGGERGQLEGAIKYVTLNLVSSTLFLIAVGLLYGMIGTLNMADMGLRMAAMEDKREIISVVSMLFLVAYGIKAGAFPLFFWLPASYHTPPTAVSALFAGLLTKVGVYALIRVFSTVFTMDQGFTGQIIVWIAGLSMLSGVLAAAAQYEIRRILSFHIISQIGYMIMGLGVSMVAASRARELPQGDPERDVLLAAATLSMVGAVFYLFHQIIVKANLFLVAGVIQRVKGHNELKLMGGLYRSHPWLGVLFLIPAFSIAGIPVFSGFWSKLMLVQGGLRADAWIIVAVSLFVTILTLYSMTKIWAEAFWKTDPTQHPGPDKPDSPGVTHDQPPGRWRAGLMVGSTAALAAATIVIGLAADPAYRITERAAASLVDNTKYIEAVLPPDYVEEMRSRIQRVNAHLKTQAQNQSAPAENTHTAAQPLPAWDLTEAPANPTGGDAP